MITSPIAFAVAAPVPPNRGISANAAAIWTASDTALQAVAAASSPAA